MNQATVFECEGASLVGIAEIPAVPCRTGVLVVTGGPQYRIGSHRQFTLLCRSLAEQGFASLRFDYRGSGDSDAGPVSFTQLQPDIAAATNHLLSLVPQINRIVMLGLCDGASAIMMSAYTDPRVVGCVLLNPWVRTTGSLEQARVRGYYPARLGNRTFWARLLSGKVNIVKSLKSFYQNLATTKTQASGAKHEDSFLTQMLHGAKQFSGQSLVLLSGKDLTAQEYRDLLAASADWRSHMSPPNVQQIDIADATHTFSSALWRKAVATHCLSFVQRLDQQD